MNEEKNNNLEEDFYEDEYLEEIEYVQASTLKELEKVVNKRIQNDFGVIEENPFWDEQAKKWTQVVLYYSDEEEEES